MGHDPRKAGPAPASVPAGSMRMPPTAAQLRTDVTVDERLAWLEQQVRSLAATAYGAAGQPHDCWAAVFPPDDGGLPDTLRADLATLAQAWDMRYGHLASQAGDEPAADTSARLHGQADELAACTSQLRFLLGHAGPSTPVQQAVDEALAEQADQVATRVNDLIETWGQLAAEAFGHARSSGDELARTEHAAEASVYWAVAQQLRNGGVA